MPKFDLVTGVSTGALQAPFAFVGTTATVSQVDDIYLNAGKRFGPSFDWFFWLRRTGGLINTENFRKLIENTFNEDFEKELQKEFAEDRQIAVSSSDFDLGVGHTWNLQTELKNPEGLKRVQSILLGASAIPGIFPSQVIDGHVQSDGGVVSNILPLFTLENYRDLSHEIRKLGFTKSIEINVWVVMNYWLYPRLEAVEVASRTEMSKRGNNFLFVLAQPQALEHLYDLTEAVSGNISGFKMHMHVTSIPSNYSNEPGAKEIFDKDWMAKLESLGQARAASDRPWDEIPSAFERPEN